MLQETSHELNHVHGGEWSQEIGGKDTQEAGSSTLARYQGSISQKNLAQT